MPDVEPYESAEVPESAPSDTGSDQTSEELAPQVPSEVTIHHGQGLNAGETGPITGARRTQLVVVAGDAESGKTTLITSLFERFREGPFAGLFFAGSLTLPAFEMRCHEARIGSERATPTTTRTRSSPDTTYLHLGLSNPDTAARLELLLTDLPGETFERARDSTDFLRQLEFLKRADRLVLLLDGKRFLEVDKRQSAAFSSTQLLQKMLDADMLNRDVGVDILVSKRDLIEAGESDDVRDAEEFIQQVNERFKLIAGGRITDIFLGSIASRPLPGSDLPFAWGVDEALIRWTSSTFSPAYTTPLEPKESTRLFDRFGQDTST